MALKDYYYNKLLDNFNFEPTNDQYELFDALADFMDDSNISKILLLTGFAGTGKTSSINAFIKVLKSVKVNFVLLAPTGRAAKVLSEYAGAPARTIHKQIYRQKSFDESGGRFTLDFNKSQNTIYIVDEASLITPGDAAGNNIFGSGNLFEDLVRYVTESPTNRLVLIGDPAQLPPIGYDYSPALDEMYIGMYMSLFKHVHLKDVVRQAKESGILHNATVIRHLIESNENNPDLKIVTDSYSDISKINGGDLIEAITDAIDKYGENEVVVLCRSNKRANRYNAGIRDRILYREELLCRGDRLMVVKNCYKFTAERSETGSVGDNKNGSVSATVTASVSVDDNSIEFIANGDVAVLQRIWGHEERYGLHFANADLIFPDYNNFEITCKIITDTLSSESASLSSEQQKNLFLGVFEDYSGIRGKKKRYKAVREDQYYNALQVKHAMAITGHKSQGGQWKCVFVDNNLWNDEILIDDLKWLYTALTRGVEKVYLVNFSKI